MLFAPIRLQYEALKRQQAQLQGVQAAQVCLSATTVHSAVGAQL